MTTHTVGLVACGKSKLTTAAPARELYTGSLFRKASAYAEATYDEWWVLSARHWLVHPDTVLEPYDHTMADKNRDDVTAWAFTVDMRLRCHGDSAFAALARRKKAGELVDIYVHAGALYRTPLVPHLRHWVNAVHVPLEGLGIGEQLHWYKEVA